MQLILIGILIAVAGRVLLHYDQAMSTAPRLRVYLDIAGMACMPVGVFLALAGVADLFCGQVLVGRGLLVVGALLGGLALLAMHYDWLPGIVSVTLLAVGATLMAVGCAVLGVM